jgi:hypothetical protein
MRTISKYAFDAAPSLCSGCGAPTDAQYFDVSSVQRKPNTGETVTLAEFELPPQYCGVLEYFAQFTDTYAVNNSLIETPDVEWTILADGSPLFPYLSFRHIVNPWGEGSFQVAVRLPEEATIKFIARGVIARGVIGAPPPPPNEIIGGRLLGRSGAPSPPPIETIGGRLLGRFWYNAAHGDAIRQRY